MSGFYAGRGRHSDNNYRQRVSLPGAVGTLARIGLLDSAFQFLAGVECHDAPGRDGNGLAGLGIAAGTRRLVAHLEIAEARQLHRLAARERIAYLFEERVD